MLCRTPWQKIHSFEELHGLTFPLVKCFGHEKTMRNLENALQEIPGLEVVVIHDSVNPELYLAMITDSDATKGKALNRILAKEGRGKGERVIAAGDDRNDVSMLRVADVRIVMETAPSDVLAEADIIAESAGKMGILRALREAVGE